jgi:hypothetical protein
LRDRTESSNGTGSDWDVVVSDPSAEDERSAPHKHALGGTEGLRVEPRDGGEARSQVTDEDAETKKSRSGPKAMSLVGTVIGGLVGGIGGRIKG